MDATAWARMQVVADVTTGEYLADFFVGGYSDAIGPCVLLDDVSLTKD